MLSHLADAQLSLEASRARLDVELPTLTMAERKSAFTLLTLLAQDVAAIRQLLA